MVQEVQADHREVLEDPCPAEGPRDQVTWVDQWAGPHLALEDHLGVLVAHLPRPVALADLPLAQMQWVQEGLLRDPLGQVGPTAQGMLEETAVAHLQVG